jgi:hypothetical protein
VENLLLSYYELGCIVSLKILFLKYHQDIFPETCGKLSSEHGECFHYISAMEKTYLGNWNSPILAECCWIVTRYFPGLVKMAGEEVASQSVYTLHHGCSV